MAKKPPKKKKIDDLFDYAARKPHFNGPEYNGERDHKRLAGQCLRIFNTMQDGVWRTYHQIATLTGDPENSISAQLRHLRKERFGSHVVNKRHLGNGLYEYQLIASGEEQTS